MERSKLLNSNCVNQPSPCRGCKDAVVIDQTSNRWFITMGHVGFNLPANNRAGYETKDKAEQAIERINNKARR